MPKIKSKKSLHKWHWYKNGTQSRNKAKWLAKQYKFFSDMGSIGKYDRVKIGLGRKTWRIKESLK